MDLFGGMMGGEAMRIGAQLWQNEINSDEATWARDHSAWQAGVSRDWQENMSNTAYQRATKDMAAAGLNPMLAYSQGGATTPGGAMGQSPMAHSARVESSMGATTAAQIRNLDADTDKKKAEADLTRGTTKDKLPAEVAALKQSIHESEAKITAAIGAATHSYGSAEQAHQQARNLREAVPQIQETVRLLRAQTSATESKGFLDAAHSQEAHQRIRANLPRLEEELKKLEIIVRELEQPGRRQTSDFQQTAAGTILKSIGNALRELNPLLPSTSIHQRGN